MTLGEQVLRIIYGAKDHDGTDAGKLRAVATMLDRIDDAVEQAIERSIDRDIQDDLRAIAARLDNRTQALREVTAWAHDVMLPLVPGGDDLRDSITDSLDNAERQLNT